MRFHSISLLFFVFISSGKINAQVTHVEDNNGGKSTVRRGSVHVGKKNEENLLRMNDDSRWRRFLDDFASVAGLSGVSAEEESDGRKKKGSKDKNVEPNGMNGGPKAKKKSGKSKSSAPSPAPTMLTCDPTDIHGVWAGAGVAVNKEAVFKMGSSVDLFSIWCAVPLGHKCDPGCDSPPFDTTDPGMEFRVCNYSCDADYKSKAYMVGMYIPDLLDNKCVLNMVEEDGAGFYRAVTSPETGTIKYQVTQITDSVKFNKGNDTHPEWKLKSYPFAVAQNEIMNLADSCVFDDFDCPDCCYNNTLPGCPGSL